MSNLDQAILSAEEAIATLAPGTPNAPKDGSTEWFTLRAASLGLAYLKRVRQLEIDSDPAACERLYREAARVTKGAE